MATIAYKCDTCDKNANLLENRTGLTILGRCVLTSGCTGKLHVVGARSKHNIREYIEHSLSTEEYYPRSVFEQFEQTVERNVWRIPHSMGINPSVVVYVYQDQFNSPAEVSSDEYTIRFIDDNTIELTFSEDVSGIAHLIARDTKEHGGVGEFAHIVDSIQVSVDGILTLGVISKVQSGTHSRIYTNGAIEFDVVLLAPNREPIYCTELVYGTHEVSSPWSDWNALLNRRRRNYNIKSFSLNSFRVIQEMYDDVKNVPNGTILQIRGVRYAPGYGEFEEVRSRNIIGLLSEHPHTKHNKIIDKIYDVGDLSRSVTGGFVFVDGDVYIHQTRIEPTYPILEKASVVSMSMLNPLEINIDNIPINIHPTYGPGTPVTIQHSLDGSEYSIVNGSGNYVYSWHSSEFTVNDDTTPTPTIIIQTTSPPFNDPKQRFDGVVYVLDMDTGFSVVKSYSILVRYNYT